MLASQLIDRLRIDEAIAYSTTASIVQATLICQGDLLLGEQRLYFVGDRCALSSLVHSLLIHLQLTHESKGHCAIGANLTRVAVQ